MLRLLLGRSGSGKTYEIYRRIEALSGDGMARPILLVPEQFSFESERALLRRLGPGRMAGVRVLSFTRMAQLVFKEVGGLAGERIDDAARALLLSEALGETADQLTLLRRTAQNAEMIRSLMSTLEECKQMDVAPQRLLETADRLDEGVLRQKTRELALVLEAYDALVQSSGLFDPLDELSRLAHRLPDSHLADGSVIFVDAFKGFTAQEMQVLRLLLRRCSQMTVSLCTDTLQETAAGLHRFSAVIRTGARLRRLAMEEGVAVEVQTLKDQYRTSDPALRALEAGCLLPGAAVFPDAAPAVEVVTCATPAEECLACARAVHRFLRTTGGRCREVAVVVRDLAPYRGILDVAFEREGIPCFLDRRETVAGKPLITLLRAGMACAVAGSDSETLLRLLKTGLTPFPDEAVSALENYLYMWDIPAAGWETPWTANPNGLSAVWNETTAKQLEQLNTWRLQLLEPLKGLKAVLAKRDKGRVLARGVYRFLLDMEVPRCLRRLARRLRAEGEWSLADEELRMWDVAMGLLDKLAAAFADRTLTGARFAELFALAAELTDLGSIPQTLDSVQIGVADRIRYASPAFVLILGANEGVFPAYPSAKGLLSDADRQRLAREGLPVETDPAYEAAEERFFVYAALSAPSKQLYISFSTQGADGPLAPSILVEAVRRLLPGRVERLALDPSGGDVEGPEEAFDRLAAGLLSPSPQTAAFEQALRGRGYDIWLKTLHFAAEQQAQPFGNPQMAPLYYGKQMTVSPSQVEQFFRCRFAYFCQYAARVKPRRKAEMDAMEAGSLVHFVMERLLPGYGAERFAVSRERVTQDVRGAVVDYVKERLGGMKNKTQRLSHLVAQLARLCDGLLWRVVLELRQSGFVPADFELPIGGRGSAANAWRLRLPDGATIAVSGVVDRVDIYPAPAAEGEPPRRYVRVIDYKTGSRTFKLAQVVEGLNLQMLIYLFSLCDEHTGKYPGAIPAGVLYLPARLPVIHVDRNAPPEVVEREQLATMKMNGLVLKDAGVVQAMEADAAGLFIPAKLDKAGQVTRSSAATRKEFAALRERVGELLREMAVSLRAGDIAARPVDGELRACDNCAYRAVCGRDADTPGRVIGDRPGEDVLAALCAAAQEKDTKEETPDGK